MLKKKNKLMKANINSFIRLIQSLIQIIINSKSLRDLDTYSLTFDNTNWSYDSSNGVYYQIGVVYCTNPATTAYNSLAIYVPKNYLSCSSSSSGKYTCTVNSNGKVGSYTATTAPIVMPINTGGYSAQKATTSYSYKGLSDYLSKGLIYLYAGCRGRHEGESYNSGAPWGVTDLKAAIRYIRYNRDLLPGDKDSIFSFGHSGGGAQSCLLGVTGDSSLYTPYLNQIGAATTDSKGNTISDAIKGSQCWCPITNLDTADMAYEWNMGQYFSNGTRTSGKFTKQLSNDLSDKYVSYINELGLKDENGNRLTLSTSTSGTYYDYLKSVIETSLNNFLKDTTFPYTPNSSGQKDGGFGGRRRRLTTYDSVSDYISSLNSDEKWITYDSSSNTATISSVGSFVKHCKYSSKDVGAFDSFSKTQPENKLFGIKSTYSETHFDKYMSDLLTSNADTYSSLSDWNSIYPSIYASDLQEIDSLGNSVLYRANMYNPLYYLLEFYDGYNKSTVASYFRINTGIAQGDTSNVVEMNLALALKNYGKKVNFTTVWDQKHILAERDGSSYSTSNFISWVAYCMGVDPSNSASSYIDYSLIYVFLIIGLLL